MKSYKIILLGSQCSGKSAIIKYLQENTSLFCVDHDEEIKKRNNGTYPSEHEYASMVLLPKIEKYVLDLPEVIYSASFFGLEADGSINSKRINGAKEEGFKFVNLTTDMNILLERNKIRVEGGKDDASVSFEWYQKIYKDMWDKKQFDLKIDTNGSIENSVNQLLDFLNFLNPQHPTLKQHIQLPFTSS